MLGRSDPAPSTPGRIGQFHWGLHDMIEALKPWVPITLRRGLQTGRERFFTSAAEARILREDQYRIGFKRVNVESEVHFVPAFARHRPASRAILAGRRFEPATHALVAALMAARPGNMVHAGTFFGDMLPSFADKCSGIVYAFEPVLEHFVLARLCVEVNDLANVMLQHAGLADLAGPARVDTGVDDWVHRGGASQISETGQRTMVTTVDNQDIGDLSVLHLDVEGFERAALAGSARTIAECRPTILIEDNAGNCSPLLNRYDYTLAGDVPGLSVWAHQDNLSEVKALFPV